VTKAFVFDLETTGIPVYSTFRCMGWSWGMEDAAPVQVTFDLEEAVDQLITALDYGYAAAGHNVFGFDLPVLLYHYDRSEGTLPLREKLIEHRRQIYDTLIFSTKLFPLRMKHSMDSWSGMIETIYGIEGKVEVEDFATASDAEIEDRCSHDIAIQKALSHYFIVTHGAPDTVNAYDVDCDFLPIVLSLTTCGVPYNRKEADRARKILKARTLGPELMRRTIAPDVNPRSNKQIDAWVRSIYGEGFPLTEKGSPMFNKQNRQEMLQKFPKLEWFVRGSASAKLYSVLDTTLAGCYENFLQKSTVYDGEGIFPSLYVHGTRTLRMAYSKPALNQFPKHIRSIVEAPEGWLMVGFDIVALEMAIIGRIFEKVLGDVTVRDEVLSGKSVKQLTLDAFKPAMEKTVFHGGDTPEDLAKRINFALLYGAGVPLLVQMLNSDETTVEECIERRFRGFRTLSEAVQAAVKGSDEEGTVQSLYGTQLRTARWKALNTVCQASGAEVAKRVSIYLDNAMKERVPESYAVIHNHDEVEFICRGMDEEELKRTVQGIADGLEPYMNGLDDGVGYLSGVNWKVGRSWADVH